MAGWTASQLPTARLIRDRPRKKRYFYIGAPFRIVLPIISIALWAGLASYPNVMLGLFFVGMTLFALSDGLMTIIWFDIMARSVPARRRGRLVGLSQFIGGVGGIGVGVLVSLILGQWEFPQSYAILFACATIGIGVSTVATLSLREPPPEEPPPRTESDRRGWLRLLAGDVGFRRLAASRLLVGMTALATPFYVVHAADALQLPESVIGTFVIATTAGSLASSILLGLVGERWGTRVVIRISSAIAFCGPLLALLIASSRSPWLARAYPLAFVAIGITTSASMLGFTNYTLEIAPAHLRPAYIGLLNTLMGLMAVVPVIGGWLLQATSYTVLFAAATILTLAGFVVGLSLEAPHSSPGCPSTP
jgi:MFS family permease